MKHWEPREWRVRREIAEADLAHLREESGLSLLSLKTCLMRGLDTAAKIRAHLSPKLEELTSPLSIQDMEKATGRVAEARARGELIRIFGDYDVDGTTGAALLTRVLGDFGLKTETRQPDRFKDGYGLNVGAVAEAAEAGAKVLITVDCGISSYDAALEARKLGVDLIVIDHHQIDPARGLPEAFAIVNPQRADCASGLKQLCGCGLAFYFALALRSRGRADGWFAAVAEPNLKQHLDLVVMATAADMVPLTGDNHILVRHGMEVLKSSKKPGVRALLAEAGIAFKDISPAHLGFVLGPRINASGRMSSASLAMELLTTSDPARAQELARELEKLNRERAALQDAIWDRVRAQVEEGLKAGRFEHGIVVASREWHEGVVGIVASRVTETFRRPAAVIALREDFGKGSVRSYGGKDVLEALRQSAETLLGFGGHKHAAGLSVAPEKVEALAEAFDRALGAMLEDKDATPLFVEGVCDISDLDTETLTELEKLGPFGPGNPEPVFAIKAAVRSHTVLKGRHLKLQLVAPYDMLGPSIEGIWFHAAETHGRVVDAPHSEGAFYAGVPELNRFRGTATPNFRIRDWRPLHDAPAIFGLSSESQAEGRSLHVEPRA